MTHVLTDHGAGDGIYELEPRVVSWRFDQLTDAGYPVDIAMLLAERADVDLHAACELLERGCGPHKAVRILL